jgi:hypothetical protein
MKSSSRSILTLPDQNAAARPLLGNFQTPISRIIQATLTASNSERRKIGKRNRNPRMDAFTRLRKTIRYLRALYHSDHPRLASDQKDGYRGALRSQHPGKLQDARADLVRCLEDPRQLWKGNLQKSRCAAVCGREKAGPLSRFLFLPQSLSKGVEVLSKKIVAKATKMGQFVPIGC